MPIFRTKAPLLTLHSRLLAQFEVYLQIILSPGLRPLPELGDFPVGQGTNVFGEILRSGRIIMIPLWTGKNSPLGNIVLFLIFSLSPLSAI